MIATEVETKQCSKCDVTKPVVEFYRRAASRKDGLCASCKSCCASYWKTPKGKVIKAKCDKRYYGTVEGYLYHAFQRIFQRCNNPGCSDYERYGARDIKCHFKNADEFINYIVSELNITDINQLKNMTIDRIDTLGHYEPGNLRLATFQENQQNSRKCRTSRGQPTSSHFKGVSWHKRDKRWIVQIGTNGKSIHLGSFPLHEEKKAALAYDSAAVYYFGEFAATNQSLGLFT